MRVVSVSWKSLTRSGVIPGAPAVGAAATEAAPAVATTMAAIAAAPRIPLIPALPSKVRRGQHTILLNSAAAANMHDLGISALRQIRIQPLIDSGAGGR